MAFVLGLYTDAHSLYKDTTIPGGPGRPDIAVLKGDTVSYSPYLMQRRRDIYPPVTAEFADPLTFSPERWYNWQPKAWEFVPFNGGPRIVSDSLWSLRPSTHPPIPSLLFATRPSMYVCVCMRVLTVACT